MNLTNPETMGNSVNPDAVTHYEPSHFNPQCLHRFQTGCLDNCLKVQQGPVVQSIVSLMSSLRGQLDLIKCFTTL